MKVEHRPILLSHRLQQIDHLRSRRRPNSIDYRLNC
jgi:hypothetical protein